MVWWHKEDCGVTLGESSGKPRRMARIEGGLCSTMDAKRLKKKTPLATTRFSTPYIAGQEAFVQLVSFPWLFLASSQRAYSIPEVLFGRSGIPLRFLLSLENLHFLFYFIASYSGLERSDREGGSTPALPYGLIKILPPCCMFKNQSGCGLQYFAYE